MGLINSSNDSTANQQRNIEDIYPLDLSEEMIKKHYQIDNNGNVKFDFKHFRKEYDELNISLQSFKSILKLESPAEMRVIEIKMNDLKTCIMNEDKKRAFEEFIEITKKDLDKYYDSMKTYHEEIKKISQASESFLSNCLKDKRVKVFNEESDYEIHMFNKTKTLIADYTQFNQQFEYIDRAENELKVSRKDLKDYDILMQKYSENAKAIREEFNFRDFPHYKSFLNTLEQVRSYLNAKMELLEKYIDVGQNMHQLYNKALKETIKSNDFNEALNELHQYYSVIIKHRLIKHVDIRLKEIQSLLNMK